MTTGSAYGDFMADGSVPMTGAFEATDGTAALPGIAFASQVNTGIYRPAANQIGFAANGVLAFKILGSSNAYISSGNARMGSGSAASPALSFENDTNTGMYNIAADTLGFTTAGTERIRISSAGYVGIGTTGPAAALDVVGDVVVSGKITASQAYGTLTDGATVTWTVAGLVNNATVTLGGNRTLAFSGLTNGMTGTLIVKQDATGSRTLTLPAQCTNKVIGGGGGAITLSTAANAIDILTFTYDGTNCYWTYGKNYN